MTDAPERLFGITCDVFTPTEIYCGALSNLVLSMLFVWGPLAACTRHLVYWICSLQIFALLASSAAWALVHEDRIRDQGLSPEEIVNAALRLCQLVDMVMTVLVVAEGSSWVAQHVLPFPPVSKPRPGKSDESLTNGSSQYPGQPRGAHPPPHYCVVTRTQ